MEEKIIELTEQRENYIRDFVGIQFDSIEHVGLEIRTYVKGIMSYKFIYEKDEDMYDDNYDHSRFHRKFTYNSYGKLIKRQDYTRSVTSVNDVVTDKMVPWYTFIYPAHFSVADEPDEKFVGFRDDEPVEIHHHEEYSSIRTITRYVWDVWHNRSVLDEYVVVVLDRQGVMIGDISTRYMDSGAIRTITKSVFAAVGGSPEKWMFTHEMSCYGRGDAYCDHVFKVFHHIEVLSIKGKWMADNPIRRAMTYLDEHEKPNENVVNQLTELVKKYKLK